MIANTRALTRIIIFLKDIGIPVTITQVREATGLDSSLSDALHWLVCNKIVCREYMSSTKIFRSRKHGYLYFLNTYWEKMRDG